MPIKWQPFKGIERPSRLPDIFEEDEWMPFIPAFRKDEPAVDIYQDKNNLYVELPLIGIKPKDVRISIENNILNVSGESQEKKEIKSEDYLRKEIRRGSFRKVVKLPIDVRSGKASAETTEGILKITIPKSSRGASKATKVPIKIK
ncbi:MAG: hypothetical protein AUJ11_02465 [Parcubacteria group bacterium CG1_02_44_65]|uniref:SHSP domain-containing protein n=2 Tax=Candidatus Portnoyibacteriota TaxID=1817913 RepID=A0A2M7YLF5_9BACT|nr:MAG: hypothetical protein AUJ11_02465 [Parcubacteria group bacterium CG1_02_44_65]PIZ69902.1 MAG: hypothetical protein COY10_00605 [Candidatus Portnoybacteria bacterium CG_4_10_14_0_2_um_filter_43_36]PJA63825.1 MAG: hypothetical protein CO160_01835 [Candidatus Portnoybacteria bacterium CG_4_9_14_3_um_filter_43_11]